MQEREENVKTPSQRTGIPQKGEEENVKQTITENGDTAKKVKKKT